MKYKGNRKNTYTNLTLPHHNPLFLSNKVDHTTFTRVQLLEVLKFCNITKIKNKNTLKVAELKEIYEQEVLGNREEVVGMLARKYNINNSNSNNSNKKEEESYKSKNSNRTKEIEIEKDKKIKKDELKNDSNKKEKEIKKNTKNINKNNISTDHSNIKNKKNFKNLNNKKNINDTIDTDSIITSSSNIDNDYIDSSNNNESSNSITDKLINSSTTESNENQQQPPLIQSLPKLHKKWYHKIFQPTFYTFSLIYIFLAFLIFKNTLLPSLITVTIIITVILIIIIFFLNIFFLDFLCSKLILQNIIENKLKQFPNSFIYLKEFRQYVRGNVFKRLVFEYFCFYGVYFYEESDDLCGIMFRYDDGGDVFCFYNKN